MVLTVQRGGTVAARTVRCLPAIVGNRQLWGQDCLVEGIRASDSVNVVTCLERVSSNGRVFLTVENQSYFEGRIPQEDERAGHTPHRRYGGLR